MATAVQHVAFRCRDRLREERFLTKHFGFRRARVFNAGQPGEFVMLRLGDTCVELFGADPESLPPQEAPTGFQHLAFTVDDLDRAIALLREDGLEILSIADASAHIENCRVCFFKDPEGHVMELMENYSDQQNPPPLTDA